MIYREAGDFKTTYTGDSQTFPIRIDRWAYYAAVIAAFLVVPLVINDYWLNAVFLPFLIYAIAALGLNILTGYCGQVSLGTGGFMAVGAYALYKLMTAFPDINITIHVVLAGLVTALVGMLFGLPSLRIKGFYLAVATLAAQFFLVWLFNRVPWFYNYSASGQINAPERTLFGVAITGPNTDAWATYLFCLAFVFASAWLARNLTRGTTGRTWMAIRDMDIAAEIIGVNPLRAKLSAFAVSVVLHRHLRRALLRRLSRRGRGRLGLRHRKVVPGALHDHHRRPRLDLRRLRGGGVHGAAAGLLKNVLVGGLGWPTDLAAHLELVIVGALIIIFLIAEPHGLAALWRTTKEKLRLWPFPY